MLHLPRMVRTTAAAVAVALGALVLPLAAQGPALAADNGAWSVSPAPPEGATTPRNYFILEGDPGTTIEDEVLLQNWTNKPITLHLYGADGYNTASDGFFALRDVGGEMHDVGAWVEPVVSRVTLHGRTQTTVPVTVTIPENASPGDHAGGLVALNTKVERGKKTDSAVDIGVQRAVGARIYVRVSGTTSPGFEVGDVAFEHDRGALPWTGEGNGTVSYTLTNTGNLRLEPAGDITLGGVIGDHSSVEVSTNVDLLPGQQVRLTQEVTGAPFLGRVNARVDLTAGEDLEESASTTVWLLPWPFIALVVALLAAAVWFLGRRTGLLRRKLRDAEDAPQISVTAGV